ncbi:MAG: family 78 glycoside hydrolase catalytic domain, partial [Clostridiales bacterium]|nr:family 78 glycoside hydrolase catalytic domain [Clostridiales bacterium]
MRSDGRGKRQTAYAIKVKQASAVLWDSGKQAGDISVGVAYDGPTLAPSTIYSWTVTVWDETGAAVTSTPASFETGLGDASSAWEGSDWIGARTEDGGEDAPENLHYTVEADVTVDGTKAVGIVFNAAYADTKSFLMWQVNADSHTKGAVVLRPHRYAGGWSTLADINLTKLLPELTVDSLRTRPLHLKIEVTAGAITTYVNDTLVDSGRAFPAGDGLVPRLGAVGAHAGTNEGGLIDNLRLTDDTPPDGGRVVYDYDFEGNKNPLGYNPLNGNTVASLENGALKMAGNGVALPPLSSAGGDIHYTVEAEVEVEKGAVGLIFNYQDSRNMLMWQVNTATAGQVRLRPHKRVNGSWSVVDPIAINVPGVSNNGGKTAAMRLKIEVTAEKITTYVNDKQIDQRATAAMGMPPVLGPAGGHSGGNESGYIDNLRFTDYTGDAGGRIVYSYDFNDGVNPLTGDAHSNLEPASVVDGRLYQTGNRWSLPPQVMQSPFPSFRKKIDVKGQVEWARLYATARGAFDMYIDGGRVGAEEDGRTVYDELKPGYTSDSKRVNYYTYDVTGALGKTGTHLLSAQLAKGWYGGLSGEVSKPLALRAKLLVKYAGQDTPVVVGTDGSWKTDYPSGLLFAAIYDGETFNGNMDESWKSELAYDDSAWGRASLQNDWSGQITAVSGSRVRVREELCRNAYTVTVYDGAAGANAEQYGKIHTVGEYTQDDAFPLRKGETAVIDFGQNFAGWPEITVSGPKDTVVRMRTGEMLNDANGLKSRGNDGPEGSVHHANYRTAASTARYIMNGKGDETYHSRYTFYGFRYIAVTASADVTVKGMRGLVLTSMLEDTGSLETSDPDVNQLISNIRWGGYSNILSVPTDCPQRNERSGWTADTQVFATTGMYLADLQNFYIKWMNDMRDAARASDGAFRTIAPINETEGYEGGWSDAGVIVPYKVYRMTGDKRILEQNWDAMQKFMDVYMASTDKNGGGTRYGDWVALENNEEDVKRLCCIAYYAGDALMMADMAQALGKRSDVTKYRQVYETEKAYFQEKYVNADGSLKRTEQTCCLMALAYDLLPDDASREKVKAALLANLESHGNKLQTGFLGTAAMMQTLSDIGAADMAYNLLLQHEFPSWLYCVDLGATTTWEHWNSYTLEDGFAYKRMNSNDPANMNSFNHYAYGAVGEWMYGYMAGVMSDEARPGFKHTILQPTPDASGRLTSAAASYESPYGRIESAWQTKNGALRYQCAVPANTTATLYLPVEQDAALLEGGVPVGEAEGVRYVGYQDGKAVYELAPGRYSFRLASDQPDVEKVTVFCDTGFAVAGKTLRLTAQAAGSEAGEQAFTWSVTGGKAGTSIDRNGVLTVAAGETARTLTVTAASNADPAVTGSLTLTVRPQGDLDGDGEVTIQDVMEACKVLARQSAG